MHVCAPFPIPAVWEIWRGADDGFANPAGCLWLALDEIYDRVYVVAELYKSGMTPEHFAREVRRIDRSISVTDEDEVFANDLALDGVIDSASFADTGMGGGRADQNEQLGMQMESC